MLQDCQQLETLLAQLESQHAAQSSAAAALLQLTQAQQQYQDTLQQHQAHVQAAAVLPSMQVTQAIEVRPTHDLKADTTILVSLVICDIML